MRRIASWCLLLGILGSASIARVMPSYAASPVRGGIGNVEAVTRAYERWQRSTRPSSGVSELTLPLGWSKGLSTEFSSARGRVTIDALESTVDVEVNDLPLGISDVWIVDNVPGATRTVRPEPGDEMLFVGSLEGAAGRRVLHAELVPGTLSELDCDLVVVTRNGRTPIEAGVLFGSPTLFQRLDHGLEPDPHLGSLVAKGEALFFEQQFGGNGRTCGTCHPSENSFTIDPDFIATLPRNDPLFVAEFVPELRHDFENPRLMREFGLILENLDGFDDLENRFVMRGVPHTLGLSVSIAPSDFDGSGGGRVPPFQRTGWSGDGAAGSGTLREFAIGAVRQHFTKTLQREPDVDFRFPTEQELDAFEAFLLSLGRQEDPDLRGLQLVDPVDRAGQELYFGAGKCNECHVNGGANADFVDPPGERNVNFDTGVEDIEHPADATGERRPRDGGFGAKEHPLGGFGDGKFNTPSVIEAADTPPFFHNNAFATIEEAVDFYTTDTFNLSPAGIFVGGITLSKLEVARLAVFLRVVNALENIRSAMDFAKRAKNVEAPKTLLRAAAAEIRDAIVVLKGASLHGEAVARLADAEDLALAALQTLEPKERMKLIDTAVDELIRARRNIQFLGQGEGLHDPPRPQFRTPRPESAVSSLVVSPRSGSHDFSFRLETETTVTLDIFDVTGRRIVTPVSRTFGAGERVITWDGRTRSGGFGAPGVYFARLWSPHEVRTVRFHHRPR